MSIEKELEENLQSRFITRRQFLVSVSAMGCMAATSAFISPRLLQAAPQKGGSFMQGLTGGSTATTLDPGTMAASWECNINWQVRNNLVEINNEFKPIPELAESWEPSSDAKTWVFNLRKGVEFHNGKPFEAQDVIESLNYHRGDASKSVTKSLLKPVTSIKADGKYRVVIQLENGSADFAFILSDPHFCIFPAGEKKPDFNKGIGTGPYILESYEAGVSALTRRNPNYWKKGRGHFDSVETLNINDPTARTSALKSGKIMHMDRSDPKTVHLLQKTKGIEVLSVTGTFHYTMPMLTDRKPYDDNNVRLALKLAMDREDLIKRVLRGYGVIGNDHPIAPVNRYFAADLPQRHYDPDKARFYMKKAGMLDHTFNLYTSEGAFQGAVDAALLYKEYAKKAGIKINVVHEPSDGYWNNVWMKKEFCMSYWSGRPTEDMMFSLTYAANAPWNETHWKNDRFNKLLLEARTELDETKRAAMYSEMQQICRDDGGTLVPAFPQIVEANSKKIGHGPLSGHMENDGNRNAERWWFKS